MATTSSAGQKVPAWKRLGLQLKPGGAASSSPVTLASGDSSNTAPQSTSKSESFPSSVAPSLGKRKYPVDGTPFSEQTPKFARRQDNFGTQRPAAWEARKAVSFSSGTKDSTWKTTPKTPNRSKIESTNNTATKKAKPKKPKKPKAEKPREPPKLGPSLEYLRQWKHDRDSWKFNKNHQTLLIKYIFHQDAVPASDVDTFYQYIRDIQGFIRTRLLQTATEVRDKDIAAQASGFEEGVKNAEGKQEKYESIVKDFTQPSAEGKQYVESEFIEGGVDKFITKRVVKRMRAERIQQELAQASEPMVTPSTAATQGADDIDADGKRIKLGSGGKAVRPRKSRQAVDESSSSESSSDEDDNDKEESESGDDDEGSDDSSSSSSDDSDDGDMEEGNNGGKDEKSDDDTSSSSSSSGEDDDDEDSDSGEES